MNSFLLIVCITATLTKFSVTETVIANLSCAFDEDMCDWKIITEMQSPQEFDFGWRTYSPNLDGFGLSIEKVHHRFAYVETKGVLRSYLISKPFETSSPFLMVNLTYLTTNTATLTAYILQGGTFKFIWSSPKLESNTNEDRDDNNETITTVTEDTESTSDNTINIKEILWKNVSISNICQVVNFEEEFQLALVASLNSDDSVGVFGVVTKALPPDQNSCGTDFEPISDETAPLDNPTGTAWKFFILFSVILCFAAIFVAALMLVNNSDRSVWGGNNNKTTVTSNHRESQDFDNPSYNFQYSKLREEPEASSSYIS